MERPEEYRSGWDAQMEDITRRILNREKFTYDVNADALYDQYKDAYTRQGKMAMMDTVGVSQAMTGGYGNSYAKNAGQQAYNAHLQGLNDRIPQLYQLALDRYQAEGDNMVKQYSLMSDQEQRDYGRHRDKVSDYYADRNFAYTQERDKVADAKWQAEFNEALRQWWYNHGGSGGGGGSYYYDPTDDKELTFMEKMRSLGNITTDEAAGLIDAAAKDKMIPREDMLDYMFIFG